MLRLERKKNKEGAGGKLLGFMLVCVFLDFDDTIFPSSTMTRFFDQKSGTFNPPKPVIEHILELDSLVTGFVAERMTYCRFRIVSHATSAWIQQALRYMPVLSRFVEWNYVSVIPCENFTKYSKIYTILSRETSVDLYFCCGDSSHDVESVPQAVQQLNMQARTRSVLFVRKPTLSNLEYEWKLMPSMLDEMLRAPEIHVARHFVVTDDCSHYAKPGWYGNTSRSTLRRTPRKPAPPGRLPPVTEEKEDLLQPAPPTENTILELEVSDLSAVSTISTISTVSTKLPTPSKSKQRPISRFTYEQR